MEEGSGYAGGNGDQVSLSLKGFYETGVGKLWKVDGLSGADARGLFFIDGDGWKMWEQFPGMDKQIFKAVVCKLVFCEAVFPSG